MIMMTGRSLAAIVWGVVAVGAVPAAADVHTLTNPGPGPQTQFGSVVQIAPGGILVGDPGFTVNVPGVVPVATNVGVVYLFDQAGTLTRTFPNPLQPAASMEASHFGAALATTEGSVVVGVQGNSPNLLGTAYEFDVASGSKLRQYPAPSDNSTAHIAFGSAVAAAANLVVVADPLGSDFGEGAVYLYDRPGGKLLRKITDPGPRQADQFGFAVATDGTLVLVGARFGLGRTTTSSGAAGSAYVFDAASGALLQVLKSPASATNDLFGAAVGLVGQSALVGAPGQGGGAGAVYVFDTATGTLTGTLSDPGLSSSGPKLASFGCAVAAAGSDVLVASVGLNPAYLFDLSTGVVKRVLAVAGGSTAQPGCAAGLAGGLAVVGAVGAADVFSGEDVADTCDGTIGQLACGGTTVAAKTNAQGVARAIDVVVPPTGVGGVRFKVVASTDTASPAVAEVRQRSAEAASGTQITTRSSGKLSKLRKTRIRVPLNPVGRKLLGSGPVSAKVRVSLHKKGSDTTLIRVIKLAGRSS